MKRFSLSRRQFFAAGCGAAATIAGSTVCSPAAHAGTFSGKIKKAVKYHMIAEPLTPLDKLKLLRDLGFDGVEPRAMLGAEGKEEARQLQAASEKLDFPIHGVVNGDRPNLVEAIDQAKAFGANSVLHVVRYDKSLPYLENYRKTQDLIKSAADHAAKQEVSILLENVWATFLIEPLTMRNYVDQIGSPWVQVYFDIGNVVRWGWPQHWLQVLGDRCKKLDVKEYDLTVAMNEGMRAAFGRPLGEGSIDWERVREELHKLKYEGWATAEVPGGDRERLADIATQMDRVLDLA